MVNAKKFLKGIFLAIISIFLVLNLNLIVYSNAVRETVLNPKFFEKELDELNFYSIAKEKLSSQFLGDIPKEGRVFADILKESITEEWMRSQVNSLIGNFFSYINSQTDELSLKISTVEVKENLFNNVKKEISKFMPPPIANDEKQIELYIKQIKKELDKNVPDEFDLITLIQDEKSKTEFKENLQKVKEGVSYFHTAFYFFILSAFILMLLISILSKKLKSILRKIGASFFVSGSSLYLGNFLVVKMVSEKFSQENLPLFITKDMLLKILQDFLASINFWAIIFMVFGICLVVGSFFVRKEGEREEKISETT